MGLEQGPIAEGLRCLDGAERGAWGMQLYVKNARPTRLRFSANGRECLATIGTIATPLSPPAGVVLLPFSPSREKVPRSGG